MFQGVSTGWKCCGLLTALHPSHMRCISQPQICLDNYVCCHTEIESITSTLPFHPVSTQVGQNSVAREVPTRIQPASTITQQHTTPRKGITSCSRFVRQVCCVCWEYTCRFLHAYFTLHGKQCFCACAWPGSLFVGCLTAQQHASVSQKRVCTCNFT